MSREGVFTFGFYIDLKFKTENGLGALTLARKVCIRPTISQTGHNRKIYIQILHGRVVNDVNESPGEQRTEMLESCLNFGSEVKQQHWNYEDR
jgi:hypothetical protein